VIAVLLVGGQGTRLLPLTEWLPKPMLPIANRPFLEHQVAHLRHHGATRVILACGYKPDAIRDHFGDELEYVVEDQPLGTGGAIAFAARELGETFVVCNGDILTDLNLTALVAFHRSRRATATIALQPVDDPSRYGLVRTTAHGEVEAFIEKPEPGQVDVNTINAGTYVMEPEVLDLVPPDVAVSVEREVFPQLVGNGLYGRAERVSWIDIGTPQSYLEANLAEMGPNGTVDPSAVIDQAAEVRDSVVGPGATVGAGARVTRSVLLPGARVEPEAVVTEQVIGMDGPVW
jgi:mannose-1-phosphate guanylyltransferase